MALHYILMGDIVDSREFHAQRLRDRFMDLIASCNEVLSESILSPYTVTLGDEFQGLARDLPSMLQSIFFLEETSLARGLQFDIRYVAVQGDIDTEINTTRAHTMMGPGLTTAREILEDKRRGHARMRFKLPNKALADQLNRLFLVYDGLTERWDPEDGPLIIDMLSERNNSKVGKKGKRIGP